VKHESTKNVLFVLPAFLHIVLLIPVDAEAHLVTTGLGPVYDGIGHLLMTPQDLLPLLALALYSGLRGVKYGRGVLFLLPLIWLAGGVAGLTVNITPPVVLPAVSFLLIGTLVAADIHLPPHVMTIPVIAAGLIHGFFSGSALKEDAGLLGLLGSVAAVFILFSLTAAFVASLRTPWTRIAVRVAGSWTVACGLLMLGWLFREAS
jgi:hydrogenase/urease accessory protein HupE